MPPKRGGLSDLEQLLERVTPHDKSSPAPQFVVSPGTSLQHQQTSSSSRSDLRNINKGVVHRGPVEEKTKFPIQHRHTIYGQQRRVTDPHGGSRHRNGRSPSHHGRTTKRRTVGAGEALKNSTRKRQTIHGDQFSSNHPAGGGEIRRTGHERKRLSGKGEKGHSQQRMINRRQSLSTVEQPDTGRSSYKKTPHEPQSLHRRVSVKTSDGDFIGSPANYINDVYPTEQKYRHSHRHQDVTPTVNHTVPFDRLVGSDEHQQGRQILKSQSPSFPIPNEHTNHHNNNGPVEEGSPASSIFSFEHDVDAETDEANELVDIPAEELPNEASSRNGYGRGPYTSDTHRGAPNDNSYSIMSLFDFELMKTIPLPSPFIWDQTNSSGSSFIDDQHQLLMKNANTIAIALMAYKPHDQEAKENIKRLMTQFISNFEKHQSLETDMLLECYHNVSQREAMESNRSNELDRINDASASISLERLNETIDGIEILVQRFKQTLNLSLDDLESPTKDATAWEVLGFILKATIFRHISTVSATLYQAASIPRSSPALSSTPLVPTLDISRISKYQSPMMPPSPGSPAMMYLDDSERLPLSSPRDIEGRSTPGDHYSRFNSLRMSSGKLSFRKGFNWLLSKSKFRDSPTSMLSSQASTAAPPSTARNLESETATARSSLLSNRQSIEFSHREKKVNSNESLVEDALKSKEQKEDKKVPLRLPLLSNHHSTDYAEERGDETSGMLPPRTFTGSRFLSPPGESLRPAFFQVADSWDEALRLPSTPEGMLSLITTQRSHQQQNSPSHTSRNSVLSSSSHRGSFERTINMNDLMDTPLHALSDSLSPKFSLTLSPRWNSGDAKSLFLHHHHQQDSFITPFNRPADPFIPSPSYLIPTLMTRDELREGLKKCKFASLLIDPFNPKHPMLRGSAALTDLIQFQPWDLIDQPVETLCGELAEHQVDALRNVTEFLERFKNIKETYELNGRSFLLQKLCLARRDGSYFTAATTYCPVRAKKQIRCLCLLLDIGRLKCGRPTLIDPMESSHVKAFQEAAGRFIKTGEAHKQLFPKGFFTA